VRLQLAKEASLYGASQVFVAAVGLVVVAIATRTLAKSEYGEVAIAISVGTLLSIIFGMSLDTSISRYYYDPAWPEGRLYRSVVSGLWRVIAVGALLSGTISAGIAIFISSPRFLVISLLVIIWASSEAFLTPAMTLVRMRRDVGKFVTIFVTSRCVGPIVTVALLLMYSSSVSYVVGLVVGSTTGLMLSRSLAGVNKLNHESNDEIDVRSLLRFSLPLVPSSLAMLVNSNLDRWTLGAIAGLDEVAVYSVSAQLTFAAQLVVSAFALSFGPQSMQLIQSSRDEASVQLSSYLRMYVFWSSVSVVGLTAVCPKLIQVIATDEYTRASRVVGILAISTVLFGITYFTTLGSWKVGHSFDYSVAILIGVCGNAVLNVVLVPRLQAVGASLATLTGTTVTVLISALFSHHRYRYRLGYLRVLLALSFTCLSVWFLSLESIVGFSNESDAIGRLVVLIVFSLITTLVLYAPEWFTKIARSNRS